MFLGEQKQGRFRPLKSVQVRVLGPTLRSSEAPGSTRELLRVYYWVRAPTTRFRPVITLTDTAWVVARPECGIMWFVSKSQKQQYFIIFSLNRKKEKAGATKHTRYKAILFWKCSGFQIIDVLIWIPKGKDFVILGSLKSCVWVDRTKRYKTYSMITRSFTGHLRSLECINTLPMSPYGFMGMS